MPKDYVDNEVAKLRREVIEWKDQVKKELQELRHSNQVSSILGDFRPVATFAKKMLFGFRLLACCH